MSFPVCPSRSTFSSCHFPNRHRAIRHPEVRRNGLLTARNPGGSGLWSRQTGENTNFQHAGDLFDLLSQSLNFPLPVLAADFARLDVGWQEKRREGGIDDVEVLISLQRAFFGYGIEPNGRVHAAELLQLAQHAGCSNRSDLNWNVLPVRQEA